MKKVLFNINGIEFKIPARIPTVGGLKESSIIALTINNAVKDLERLTGYNIAEHFDQHEIGTLIDED